MQRVLSILILLLAVYQNCNAKQCPVPGKFPQDEVGSCSGYVLCLMAGIDVYVQHNLTCPQGFLFNHLLSRCTKEAYNYYCDPNFECTEPNLFLSPLRNRYIACVEGMNDIMTARSVECPSHYIFNLTEGSCVKSKKFGMHRLEESMNKVGELTAFHVSVFLVVCVLHRLFLKIFL